METIGRAIIAVFVLLLIDSTVFSQVKPSSPQPTVFRPKDYAELEAKLKELDQLPDDTIVTVKADNKPSTDNSSPNLIITVATPTSSPNKSSPKNTLLKIDTSRMTSPTKAQVNKILAEPGMTSPPITSCVGVPDVIFSNLGSSGIFRLQADYKYLRGDYSIFVPKGFEYDRASIPAAVFWAATKDNVGDPGPLIHDYLYRHGGRLPAGAVSPHNKVFWRKEADELLLELMERCGVRKLRRNIVFGVVREVSGRYWKGTDNNN